MTRESHTRDASVHVIIPALNEEQSLPSLLTGLQSVGADVIVVDNGSTDGTAEIARRLGATVVQEAKRGYGAACLAGIQHLHSAPDTDIVVFLDADGSDNPEILPNMIVPLQRDATDFVLASRTLVPAERGALTGPQRVGNRLACTIMHRVWGVRFTDLAPCRALRLGSLRALRMTDQGFGWTVQMQVRAVKAGLRISEVPSPYRRRRFDESKISGRIGAGLKAGVIIFTVIGREMLQTSKRTEH